MDPEAVPGGSADDGARKVEEMWQREVDRQRVDVAKLCSTREGRGRLYGVLLQVDRWRLLHDIAPYIRVEKGAATRGTLGSRGAVADACAAAIHAGFDVFDELSNLMQCVVGAAPQFVRVAKEPTAYEGVVQFHAQRWLDALAESVRHVGGVLETIAGFGGCGVEGLRRFGASTGIEAAWRVSWSMKQAITGEREHPFLWLGLVAGEKSKSQPATGRDRPATPDETAEDDRTILVAVARGAKTPKEILAKLNDGGEPVRYQLLRQRKKDLVRWRLIVDQRGKWQLTDVGRAWVQELRALGGSGAGSPKTAEAPSHE
jgi:hypothetical protein